MTLRTNLSAPGGNLQTVTNKIQKVISEQQKSADNYTLRYSWYCSISSDQSVAEDIHHDLYDWAHLVSFYNNVLWRLNGGCRTLTRCHLKMRRPRRDGSRHAREINLRSIQWVHFSSPSGRWSPLKWCIAPFAIYMTDHTVRHTACI